MTQFTPTPRWIAFASALWLLLSVGAGEARAGMCVTPEDLSAAIDRLALQTTQLEKIPLLAGCLSGGYGTHGNKLLVDDTAHPQSDGIKRPPRSKREKQRADAATRSLISTTDGKFLFLRAKNPSALYMTPKKVYTFHFELVFQRIVATSTAATAGELDAAYDSPCVSHIWLWSRDAAFPKRRRLSTRDGFDVEFRLLGPHKGRVENDMMNSPYFATFRWFPNTGGERQRVHLTIKANGTKVYRVVDLRNECTNRLILPARKGFHMKLKVGYPLVGVGMGYKAEGPHLHFGVSADYDYYLFDLAQSDRIGSHILSLDWRAGPELGDFAMLASVAGGVALNDNRFSLYYSPRLVFAQRGTSLSLQIGAAGFGGDKKDLTWLIAVEWGAIFGDRPPGQPVEP